MRLTVDTDITVSLLGKTPADLQDGIVIGKNAITGTLKYVTEYTGFDSNPELQEGHYLATHYACNVEGATITVEIVGGTSGPVALDSDLTHIAYIRNTQQSLKVVATAEGYDTVTRTFSLAGLTLAPQA